MYRATQLFARALGPAIVSLMCFGTPAVQHGAAQTETRASAPTVRQFKIKLIATSPAGIPSIPLAEVRQAWGAGDVAFAVEAKLDADTVVAAAGVIRDMYAKRGHSVRVEHTASPLGAGPSVEVEFLVIELCSCRG